MNGMTGRCFCGAIEYRVTGKPTASGACHCRDCQYLSGGGPAYVMLFHKDVVAITKGSPRAYWSAADTGNRVARLFCEACGTPMFAENAANPNFIAIKVGSLDDPSMFKPQGHIWIKSAQPWHYINPDLPRWDKDPG